jgi:hypothetical protein
MPYSPFPLCWRLLAWTCSTFGLALSAGPGQAQAINDRDTASQVAAPSAEAALAAPAAEPAEDPNAANNPLTPKITLNFHEYHTPQLEGVPDRDANSFLFRGVIPHKTFGIGQLFRYTLPIVTTPSPQGGSKTGLAT